jgi:hypothetical protein
MKKQLLKKFSTFIVPITIGMLFSSSANAQIVYTDVNPDSAYACNGNQNCTNTYFLDLNNDGLVDFRINLGNLYHNSNVRWVSIIDSVGNAFAISTNGAKKFFMNDTIGPAQTWLADTLAYLRHWGSAVHGSYKGEWIYETDKYLGLALNVSGLTYYGWVRLDVTVDASTSTCICIIKDFAYNSIPNQPILAGQTTVTGIIENSFSSSINLFPNPATNHLTIALGSNSKKVEVTIADITGKIIPIAIGTTTADYPDSPDSYRDREQKIEVSTEDFAEGIYIVRIQSGDFIGTKKLIVKK